MHTLTYYRIGLSIGWLEQHALQTMWEASLRKWAAPHDSPGFLTTIDARRQR
jgi:hypothetical protein